MPGRSFDFIIIMLEAIPYCSMACKRSEVLIFYLNLCRMR